VRRADQAAAAPRAAMTGTENGRLVLLVAVIPVLMMTVVGNQQYNNAFPLWSQKYMDLVLFGWQVPVSWLQAIDAAASTAAMVGSIAFWRWWATRRREPDEVTKMAIGSLIAATAPALLVIASGIVDHSSEKVGFGWAIGYAVLNDIGFANVMPVGLALYSRTAPHKLEGLMMGTYYLHLFLANTFIGWLAGFLETMPGQQFWGLHAALVGGAGVVLLGVKLVFGKLLAPTAVDNGQGAAPGSSGAVPAH
jgi:POT family proton-dependent oligopeptide transporter